MAAARAIAPSALGTPTEIRFPTLSVQVKTTACPVVLLPAPQGVKGSWDKIEDDDAGLKYLLRDGEGTEHGYVLTRDKCQERVQLARSISRSVERRVGQECGSKRRSRQTPYQ